MESLEEDNNYDGMSRKSVIINTKQGVVGVSKASSELGPNEEISKEIAVSWVFGLVNHLKSG